MVSQSNSRIPFDIASSFSTGMMLVDSEEPILSMGVFSTVSHKDVPFKDLRSPGQRLTELQDVSLCGSGWQ
eukprot:5758195-Amphidinium_carterae.4